MGKEATLAWEERWARPVGLATLAAVALLIGSLIVASSIGSGSGEAETLRLLHAHQGDVTISTALRTLAFVLLIAPLAFLFRAAAARSDRMRRQFLGLVIAAPIFLAVGSVLSAVAVNEAANDFTAGKVQPQLTHRTASHECTTKRREDQSSFKEEFGGGTSALGACAREKEENDAAERAITGASLRGVAGALQLAGGLAFAFAMAYSALYGMRVGLLSRFWGSLGIALGVAFLLPQFGILSFFWFVYFGLLACGWLPGGRPPAWAAGEAIPWPTPGEAAARRLEGGDGAAEEPQSIPEPEIPREGESPPEREGSGERPKKRKRRDTGEPGEA